MIDIHSHFFNLYYLPVAGIIRRYSNNRIPHIIALGVERLFLRGTETISPKLNDLSLFRSSEEIPILIEMGKKLPEGEEKAILSLTEKESVNRILNKIARRDIQDVIVIDALNTFQAIEAETAPADTFLDLYDFRISDVENKNEEKIISLIERLLNWVARKIEQGYNYIKWFGFMQHSERYMVDYLSTIDEKEITLFIHQLMDVDYFFDQSPKGYKYSSSFRYDEQINNMEQLNKIYKGKLAAMVAFDPSKEDPIKVIDDAIKKDDFVGVKFYPPMGYKAYDDKTFGQKIEKLFDYCCENDVPLFSHCNKKGFEAFPKNHSGYFSNPMTWMAVLAQAKYQNLRLCLAHAGGVEGWFAEIKKEDQIHAEKITDIPLWWGDEQSDWNTSYAKIVYKLCIVYPNVYCDAAYLDEITDPNQLSVLKKRLQTVINAEPKFSKKIIYGSDWHMLFQEGKNQHYLQHFIDLFNDQGFNKEQRDDFFINNAKRYLKL